MSSPSGALLSPQKRGAPSGSVVFGSPLCSLGFAMRRHTENSQRSKLVCSPPAVSRTSFLYAGGSHRGRAGAKMPPLFLPPRSRSRGFAPQNANAACALSLPDKLHAFPYFVRESKQISVVAPQSAGCLCAVLLFFVLSLARRVPAKHKKTGSRAQTPKFDET